VVIGEAFASVLAAAKIGEEWAWVNLYRDLAGPVTGYLRGRGAGDSEDLASETFLNVAKGIRSFSGDEQAFRSWVFVIAHRRLTDARRSAARRPLADHRASDDGGVDQLPGGDAEDDAMSHLDADAVESILSRVTQDQRDVIKLRIVGGFSVAETAKILGKSDGAVKVIQHRALQALRRHIDGPA
jgi:RNA polymerase sigma-70 factor (ECF subfamily)